MTAQEKTLDQYHKWMQLNAASHLIRAARQLGVFDQLREGQKTLEQLCDALSLDRESASLLLDGLVALGVIEQYGDDYALSQAAQLLCLYDHDLGDQRWDRLVDRVRGQGDESTRSQQQQYDLQAATQWIHTQAAMQAAEILDIGGDRETQGPRILDLGCGSAVWSCAMAHRDPQAQVTAVDHGEALAAARRTADSIGLKDRFETIEGDPLEVDLPAEQFDLVVIPQRISSLSDEDARRLLKNAVDAARRGGRVVVIDLYRGPTKPNLAECTEALTVHLQTPAGYLRSLQQIQQLMQDVGLADIQFTFLPASRINLGMAVGRKPELGE